jgi:hypothetical protein
MDYRLIRIRKLIVVCGLLGVACTSQAAPLSLPSGSLTVSSDTTYEGGIIGTSGAPTLTVNAGITATFAAGSTLLYGTGGRWNLRGAGTFLNQGTLAYSNELNVGLSWQASSATFINEGVFDFVGDSVSGNNGGLYFYDAGQGAFINSNGTIQASSGNTHNIGQNGGFMASYGGTIRVTNSSGIKFDQNDYYLTNVTFETYGSGTIRLRKSPTLVHGTAVGAPLRIDSAVFSTDSSGTILEVGGEGIQFGSGTTSYSWTLTGGTVMENKGVWTFIGSGGAQHQSHGSGMFLNSGTVYQFNTSTVGIRPYGGSDFQNSGTWVISNSYWYCGNAGSTFENLAGGMFINYGSSYYYRIAGDFRNQGTIESRSGTMNFNDSATAINSNTMAGGVLMEGTWKAIGGNINFGFTTTDITIINTNASAILGGTSTIDELDVNGAGLSALYGTLGLWSGKVYSNAPTLTTDPSTRLSFGLDNTGTNAMLILGDDTTLQAAIDVVDVGALGKGDFTVVKMAPGKTLVDGGIVPGTVTSDNELFIQVVVTAGMDGTVVLKVRPPATGTVFSFQ